MPPNSRHYYKGLQVEEPREWEALTVKADWTNKKEGGTINIDNLLFAGQTAQLIIDDLAANGYFEGRPYRIEVGEQGNPAFTYNGFLDATKSPLITEGINTTPEIEVALTQAQGRDWLVEVAKAIPYRQLASDSYTGPGKITSDDYLGVPYVINFIPDGVELLILSISTFMLSKELVESIQSIADQTTALINGVTPVTGTSAGFGAGVVTAWDLGDIVAAIINLAVTVAYTVGITFALVKLIEQIIEQLAPKKRIHLGMSIKSLFVKGLEAHGLILKSTLLDNLDSGQQWVIIPTKDHRGGEPPQGLEPSQFKEVGFPTSRDGLDNLGQVIDTFSTVFNADYQIKDGVFEFERKDFWQNNSSYTIPSTLTNQEKRVNEYTPNTDEIKSNYSIEWRTDLQDQNTLSNTNGLIYQVVTSPKSVTNPDLVNLKGSEAVNVPFSMALRKNELTAVEEVLKVFLQAADFLSGQLDQPGSFASKFSARIGSMNLSSHFLSVPKMVVMSGGQLATGQRQIMAASELWNQYHFIESFVTIDGKNKQQIIVEEQEIDFCFGDFVSLANNNFAQIDTGEKAEVMLLDWEVEKNKAKITYRVYRVYDDNLKLTFLE